MIEADPDATVRVKLILWDREPLAPPTVITNDVAGAALGTATVSTAEDCVPPETATTFPEEKVAVGMPDETGVTVALRLTVPPKDPRLVT